MDNTPNQAAITAAVTYTIAACASHDPAPLLPQPTTGDPAMRRHMDCLVSQLGPPENIARDMRNGHPPPPAEILQLALENCSHKTPNS